MTKISSSLPDYEENGLNAIEDRLINHPHDVHLVIGFIDTGAVTVDHRKKTTTATVRFRSIEAIANEADRAVAARLMKRALEKRTGLVELPFALESDINNALRGQQ